MGVSSDAPEAASAAPAEQPLWGADNSDFDDAAAIEKALRAASSRARTLAYFVRNEHLRADRRALYAFVQRLRADARFAECDFVLRPEEDFIVTILNRRVADTIYDARGSSYVRDAEFLAGHEAPATYQHTHVALTAGGLFLALFSVIAFFLMAASSMNLVRCCAANATTPMAPDFITAKIFAMDTRACAHCDYWQIAEVVPPAILCTIGIAMMAAADRRRAAAHARPLLPDPREIEWARKVHEMFV
jgi:hypothetical protein